MHFDQFYHFIVILIPYAIEANLQQQYAFAHRVNSKNDIASALASGVNGIELDLCYNNNWIVSHYDFSSCNGDTLQNWLIQLNNSFTSFPVYIHQLAMLWFDFKTPGNSNIDLVPNIVHSIHLPSTLEILYDLVSFDTNGQNGFQKLKHLLSSNEGISFCAGKSCGGSLSRVTDIYNYYKSNDFERGTFNSGDALDIDKSFLTEANTIKANLSDPYRFKLVFTWTIGDESQMNDYMNPNNLYKTDGQIIGVWWRGWQGSDTSYVTAFNNAIDLYSTSDELSNGDYNPFIIQITTSNPTTTVPTTSTPTTSMPTTVTPTTYTPTTSMPTTLIPTTSMPTTNEPTVLETTTNTVISTTLIETSEATLNTPTIITTLAVETTRVRNIKIYNSDGNQMVMIISIVVIVSTVVLCICFAAIAIFIVYCKVLKTKDKYEKAGVQRTEIEMKETVSWISI